MVLLHLKNNVSERQSTLFPRQQLKTTMGEHLWVQTLKCCRNVRWHICLWPSKCFKYLNEDLGTHASLFSQRLSTGNSWGRDTGLGFTS